MSSSKRLKTVKTLRLNGHTSFESQLGIALSVSVTSATILTAKRTKRYIFVYGFLGREDGCRCDRNTKCNS